MNNTNKFFEKLGIALVIIICAFSSWIFISRAGLNDFGEIGDLGGSKDIGGDEKIDESAKPSVYYFINSIDSNPSEVGNYWYDIAGETPASEVPDLSVDQLNIVAGADYVGNAVFNGQAVNEGTVSGNAVFNGDESENNGTVTGTLIRSYNTSVTVTRDFTQDDSAWTVVATDGVVVNLTGATYNQNTIFSRVNGGSFISNFSYLSAKVNNKALTITYNSLLDTNSIPAAEDFIVKLNDEDVKIEEINISGSDVILSLVYSIPAKSEMSFSYNPGETVILSSNGLASSKIENLEVTIETPAVVVEKAPVQNNGGGFFVYNLQSAPVTNLNKTKNKVDIKTSPTSDIKIPSLVSNDKVVITKPETSNIVNSPSSGSSITNPVAPVQKPVDTKLVNSVVNKLLLAVEDKGKIWYVSPSDNSRHEIRPENAKEFFSKVSLGITNNDLNKIPVVGSQDAVTQISQRLTGRFLLQVENHGETWFVDQAGYKHLVTGDNLVDVTKTAAVGITNEKLDLIPSINQVQ